MAKFAIRVPDHIVDGDGRVLALNFDAPGFVAPVVFTAASDDPDEYPARVALEVEVWPWNGPVVSQVVIEPRLEFAQGSDLLDSPYEYLGTLPAITVPTLLREAVAHAAMPASKPFRDEIGKHVTAVLKLLPVKRAPRIPRDEQNLIRFAYEKALNDPELKTKYEQREHVFEQLHRAYPDSWPRNEDLRMPERDRLRSWLADLDREREEFLGL